jgi:hypothetical protein
LVVLKEIACDEIGIDGILFRNIKGTPEGLQSGFPQHVASIRKLREAGAQLPIGAMNKAEHGVRNALAGPP